MPESSVFKGLDTGLRRCDEFLEVPYISEMRTFKSRRIREAKAVLQDISTCDRTPETLALLKILALGKSDVEAGRLKSVCKIVSRLRTSNPPT